MTDWEQPHWSGKPQPRPDAKPKLKPGFFARLARQCAQSHLAVMALFLAAALLSAGFAALNLDVDPGATAQINLDQQTEQARQALAQRFPAIDQTFLAIVTDDDSDRARGTALSIAAALSANGELFAGAFVPGTGEFYERYAILFQDAAEIEARVAAALQMQPLYHALAAAPDLKGLTALVSEIGRSVAQGRSPPGLEGLLGAVSASVEGEAGGQPRPLNWSKLTGLASDTRSERWFVIATPVAGAERQAATYARHVTSKLGETLWLWPSQALGLAADPLRDFAVPAGLAALAVLTILAAGLGGLRFVLPVVLATLATVCLGAGAAALINPKLDGATWSFASAVLAPALVLNIVLVLAHAQARARGVGVHHAIMLAAHRRGGLLVALASIFIAFWLSWMVRQIPSLGNFASIATLGTVIALITSLTLVPAALAAFDRQSTIVEVHWLDAAIAAGSSRNTRNIGQVVGMLMIAAGVFCAIFLPAVKFGEKPANVDPPALLETPDARGAIHVLTASGNAANGLVQQLARLPETGAIRWIEQFMPPDVDRKTGLLRQLDGLLPSAPSPPAPADPPAIAASFTDLQQALQVIAGSSATSESLRDAANRLRRAVALYTNPDMPSPGRVLALEDSLFSGLAQLSQSADLLAKLQPPRLTDLDQALYRRFVADDGLWRIEIMPKAGVSALAFAASVRKLVPQAAGEPVLALSRNEITHHEAGIALAAALTAAMILAFASLRDLGAWLLTLLPGAFFFTLSAAAMAGMGLAINSALLAALCTVAALGMASAILLAEDALSTADQTGERHSPALRAAVLPVLVLIGTVGPLALSSNPAVAEFGAVVSMLLVIALSANAVLIPASAQWLRQLTWH